MLTKVFEKQCSSEIREQIDFEGFQLFCAILLTDWWVKRISEVVGESNNVKSIFPVLKYTNHI